MKSGTYVCGDLTNVVPMTAIRHDKSMDLGEKGGVSLPINFLRFNSFFVPDVRNPFKKQKR